MQHFIIIDVCVHYVHCSRYFHASWRSVHYASFLHFFVITMIWSCTGVEITTSQADVQPVLQDKPAPCDQQQLPQQLHPTAEEPHVPTPGILYHLPTQQHIQAGSKLVYPPGSQQQEVTPQGRDSIGNQSFVHTSVVIFPHSILHNLAAYRSDQ